MGNWLKEDRCGFMNSNSRDEGLSNMGEFLENRLGKNKSIFEKELRRLDLELRKIDFQRSLPMALIAFIDESGFYAERTYKC